MTPTTVFRELLDPANRADPYPLYRQLRETPVARQDDGSYVVSTYREIVALFHDPRISSDPRRRPQPVDDAKATEAQGEVRRSFIVVDPPEHDRLRRLAMRHFGPPSAPNVIDGMRGELARTVDRLIDRLDGMSEIDIVDEFAYPFPVTVICELLGVPVEDESRFRVWADAIVGALDPSNDQQERGRRGDAVAEMSQYFAELIDSRRARPGADLLSKMATDDDGPDGRMSADDLIATANLLLIAGHETTVNLITNGVLTLLRHPTVYERLRQEPELAIPLIEELLRYEPPVQLLPERTAMDDIVIRGTAIPKGSPVILVLAAGNRDPERFPDPHVFDPDRRDNQHLGFASGIRYCFGAPLARLEAQAALIALVRRLDHPHLLSDPPPYRRSPALRGPRHLFVGVDGVRWG
jgi:cytochrome P450